MSPLRAPGEFGAPAAVRTLVVGERLPWPEDHGAAMRLAGVVRGLARLGEVEVFCLVDRTEEDGPVVDPPQAVRRVGTVARPAVALTRARRVAWLAAGRVPLELFGRDFGVVQETFASWARPPYDLVWFGDAEAFVALGAMVDAPSVVDFDDLEDQAAWLKGTASDPAGARRGMARLAAGVGDLERRARRRRNGRRWQELRESAVRSGAVLAVCSRLDRSRLGLPGSVVVPNGYPAPAQALGRAAVGQPPTVLFPGFLRYAPNVDAARRLVHEIGPHLWARMPELQIRLVGLGDERTRRMHDPPRVVVTGRVEDMGSELARADVLAVPLRHGGGTRIKILEAFAHRIPVVATSIGAEGLDARDGKHLLVRDDQAGFAAACLSLLEDGALRASLVAGASWLFQQSFRSDAVERLVADVGVDLIRARGSAPAGRDG